MADPRARNLAKILVQYSTRIQEGDIVGVVCTSFVEAARPLIDEVYREVLSAGAHPHPFIDFESTRYIFFSEANDAQLEHIDFLHEAVYKQLDVIISITCASNTRLLTSVEASRMGMYVAARRELNKILNRRSAEGSMRWVGTMCPSSGYAQEAEMSIQEYEDFVYGATFADTEDPIARWQGLRERQEKLVRWLEGKQRVALQGPDIDLEFSIEGRRFVNSSGEKNMPSGEIFTGPVEDSVNGWVKFSYPALRWGQEIANVELTFEDGKVVRAAADKNEALLLKTLETDPGARYLGEFGIGTNDQIDRFTKYMLFDEKMGGTIHLALGFGFPETGSENESAIHWDLLCDMKEGGEIWVDGEKAYDSGEFLI